MTLRDIEVIELLADRPELLAIADAVSASRSKPARPHRARRRIAVRGAIVAAAAAALIVGILVAPQGGSGIVGRALAAIGDGPIMHLVTEMPSGTAYVNLKTGERTAPLLREELWTDEQGHRLHLVLSESGRVLGDLLLPQDASSHLDAGTPDPAFTALWTGYRAALQNGTAKLAGRGTVEGRAVYWLRFKPTPQTTPLPPPTTEVAVDARTYKPVLYRTLANGRQFDQRILVAKAIPYDPADFERRGPSLYGNSVESGTSTGPTNSSTPPTTVVRAPWLTAGTTVAGLKLGAVTRLTDTATIRGKKTTVRGIELVYGPLWHGTSGTRSTTVDEVSRPEEQQPWRSIPAGTIQIQTGGEETDNGPTHTQWTGYLERNGIYVTITTLTSEHALLTIARSLHPAS